MKSDIFTWIKEQEAQYGQTYEVMENWPWNMKEHIKRSLLFKHGKFIIGTNELEKKQPNKNIIYPLLNLRYRAEDIDLKEVTIYVNAPEQNHKSFLIKKYHDEVYVREHDLDTLFDELKEEKIDYGGCLVRKGAKGWVQEPLDTIAFCDQTDIMAGPIAFKIFFSPDKLLEQASAGWGEKKNGADITLDELVTLADEARQVDSDTQIKIKTPGKQIEIYRVHGTMPTAWLTDKNTDKERFTRQLQIVAFYEDVKGQKKGVTLYKKKENYNPFKVHLPGRKIPNRALVFGGVEELFDQQIWTNFAEICKKNLLKAASFIAFQTTDEGYANRNQIKDMESLEVTVTAPNTRIDQIPNASPNIGLFNESLREWEIHAQQTAGATDALMGNTPSSGSPFRLQALVVQQGQELHKYRMGKFASFIEQLYTDENGILADISREITDGVRFLATLSQDEMEYVADCLARSEANKWAFDELFKGRVVLEPEFEAYKQKIKDEFSKGGNQRFLEILKNDMKDAPLSVKVNVAGKQKDLLGIVDKMTNIFTQVLANPQILQNPAAAKIFNKLVEYSGLNPIDFGYATQTKSEVPQVAPQQGQPQIPQLNLAQSANALA